MNHSHVAEEKGLGCNYGSSRFSITLILLTEFHVMEVSVGLGCGGRGFYEEWKGGVEG